MSDKTDKIKEDVKKALQTAKIIKKVKKVNKEEDFNKVEKSNPSLEDLRK